MPDIHDKLVFPQTDEKYNFDYDIKANVDCLCYKHRISLSTGDEKLEDIFGNLAVFNRYRIKEIMVVSKDDGVLVYPNDGDPFPYDLDAEYEDVEFAHPGLEELLEEEGYEIDLDFKCKGGDYFLSAELCEYLTVDQLRELLVLDCVEKVEIELDVLEE